MPVLLRTERERLSTLIDIYELWTAPLSTLHGREELQNHPRVAQVKWDLEAAWVPELDARVGFDPTGKADACVDAPAELRRLAARDLVPPVYRWLAADATWAELVQFLAAEGGPDAGFDDLVAQCQIGIHDGPKVALARNYWDELGRGTLAAVHTVLHDELVDAIAMPRIPRDELPVGALERIALGGLLATNRRYQPEMIGALGLIELQAGPRCRAVVRALHRLDAPPGAFPFYEEHANADPRHGREWVDEIVAPLATEHPGWAARILRGARWRSAVNDRFFSALQRAPVGAGWTT